MWVIGIAGKYRASPGPKEPICTKNNQLWISLVIEIKRERFIKALFLCLFIHRHISVDRSLQPLFYELYRKSKPCVHVHLSAWDKFIKPVD
jgi:hypothetical protein